MAAVDISIGDFVSIDGSGLAQVKERVYRGFGTFYMVRLCDSDFEVEIEHDRLQFVRNARSDPVQQTEQTTKTNPGSRFTIVSESEVDDFNHQQTNRNTLIKTANDLKILQAFFDDPAINERRKLHEIQVPDLSSLLCRFIVGVKKQDGNDYQPNCLRGMISSFDRQLRRHNYGQSIINGAGFAKVRDTLSMKQKQLKGEGKGNLPKKSDPITDADIELFWQKGQLGASTPDSILQTMWFYNTVHFGLRSVQEHRDICWGDIVLESDEQGHEYLAFTERQTKTRTGINPRDTRAVKPKLWANLSMNDRCPIKIYKQYAERRPSGYSQPDSPFYIATTTVHSPSPNDTWFRRNPVGVNKLASMMKRMVQRAGIASMKHLSNHSARKYLIQKLNDHNVPANQIMQISGHKNISSINNYCHINENQHKEISSILHSSENTRNLHTSTMSTSSLQVNSSSLQADSTSSCHISGGFQNIFAAPIHGGTFHVHIYQHDIKSNPKSPERKRARLIADSDSDSQ